MAMAVPPNQFTATHYFRLVFYHNWLVEAEATNVHREVVRNLDPDTHIQRGRGRDVGELTPLASGQKFHFNPSFLRLFWS